MVSNLDRIKYELELSGYKLDQEEFDYSNAVGKCAYEICQIFSKQGHSGFSAKATLQLIKRLLIDEDILSPLTDNKSEWVEITQYNDKAPLYQSKRKFSCFSTDLKTYYDINESDDKGRVYHKLKNKE